MDISVLDLLIFWLKVKVWQTLPIFFNLYGKKGSFEHFIGNINQSDALSVSLCIKLSQMNGFVKSIMIINAQIF